MPMEYYLANNEPRNGNKQKYKILYNKMKEDNQFQEAELLQSGLRCVCIVLLPFLARNA